MSGLIVEPYLIELIRRMDAEGFPLIVAGGLGLHLKRRWVGQQVREHGRRTLLGVVPEARATRDIDVFLQMDIFTRVEEKPDRVERFRQALAELAYDVHEEFFQFKKGVEPNEIKLDLHTRMPGEHEKAVVKYKQPRVGRRHQPVLKLHGYGTPEAFAIDDGPQTLPLVGADPDGARFTGEVRVPHPFAALCMKIQAATDYEKLSAEERAQPDRAVKKKHAFDVYRLLAMLDLREVDEIRELARRYADEGAFRAIQAGVGENFRTPEDRGCLTIRGEARELAGSLELGRFTAVLVELFGAR